MHLNFKFGDEAFKYKEVGGLNTVKWLKALLSIDLSLYLVIPKLSGNLVTAISSYGEGKR